MNTSSLFYSLKHSSSLCYEYSSGLEGEEDSLSQYLGWDSQVSVTLSAHLAGSDTHIYQHVMDQSRKIVLTTPLNQSQVGRSNL